MTPPTSPRIAIALGAGGAKGLAHLSVLAALDEMGLKPVHVSGSSIGAITGAAYAAGIPAADLQKHAMASFQDRAKLIARLLQARVGKFSDITLSKLWAGKIGNPVLVDGELLLDLFWPEAVPDRFEALAIPFTAVATDYHQRCEVRLSSGPLTPAVAASMAIPGLVRPVTIGGRMLIDGGAVNPLPYDVFERELAQKIDLTIAVDLGGGEARNAVGERPMPDAIEAMMGASQIMMGHLVQHMIARQPPGLLIRPKVDHFSGLEFMRVKEIIAAGDSIKDDVKRQVEAALAAVR